MKKIIFWVLTLALSVSSKESHALCAMCRKTLEENGAGAVQGFYWSIVILCGIPLLIFAFVATVYIRLGKKVKNSN